MTNTSKKRSRIVSPQTALPNKASKTTLEKAPGSSRPLYSQITKIHLNIPHTDIIDHMEWATTVQSKLETPDDTPFDPEAWSFDTIAEALTTPEGIYKFTKYKLTTSPVQSKLPEAIRLKFVHRDTRFFTTFTRNQRTQPAHQKEYISLYNDALETYKEENEVTFTNRETRTIIYSMLRKMLISQYLASTNFAKLTIKATYELVRYARGFLQIKDKDAEDPKMLKKEIQKAIEERLLPLP
jgi:hypothetical protein